MSETNPMNARRIESLSPVYSIACADVISEYIAKKEQRGDPSKALNEGAKLKDCVNKAASAVDGTPCEAIVQDYQDCLLSGRIVRVECMPIKLRLEECAAKHVGKLD